MKPRCLTPTGLEHVIKWTRLKSMSQDVDGKNTMTHEKMRYKNTELIIAVAT